MGDSKVIIDWALNLHSLQSINLYHWLGRVRGSVDFFPTLSIRHVYQEFNSHEDALSKQEISIGSDSIFWKDLSNGVLIGEEDMSYY